MRIAHVNLARSYRGGERQTELLARGLAEIGYQQTVVARRGGQLATRLSDSKVIVCQVSGNPFSAAMATGDVDIVHVHDGRSIYAAWLRQRLSRTPYVITRRVNNPIGRHALARRVYRDAACVVGVSNDIGDIVASYDPGIRRAVIHSASSGFVPNQENVARILAKFPGKFIVGHVGALDNEQKGQEFIIEVARELAATNPDIQFLLVGGGDDEAMLRASATGLTNLEFTGFVDNVGDYLAAFDLFILPSNKEGIGGILLDAMDQQLPVIASRVGGLHEIVHEDENGLLIEPARSDQLQAGILKLRHDPDLMQRFGARGQAIAREYSAAAMCRKYLDIYQSIAANTVQSV